MSNEPEGRPAKRRRRQACCRRQEGARRGPAPRAPAPQRPERAAARGGRALRRAAAHPGRRRLGEDPRAHASRRLPHSGARRAAQRDRRHHLHQQGGRRDEVAHRGSGRPRRAHDVDQHLPQHVRPYPAPRGAAAGLLVELLDPRRGRPPAPHQALPRAARSRRQALHARIARAHHQRRQESAHRRGRLRRAGGQLLQQVGRPGLSSSTSRSSWR